MAAVACLAVKAANFCGEWSGNLSVGAVSLKLVLHIQQHGDAYACTLDSPMQGATGIPCTASVSGDSLSVAVTAIGATYKAVLTHDGAQLEGVFSQMGQTLPLMLKRVVKQAAAPKPYQETEVTIDAGNGVHLAGTFSLPQGTGPFPAVVMLTGSGAHDRDETIGDHKPFAQIADSLTRHGIAVLRCDDRGVGGSSAATGDETTATFAADALAMLRALKAMKGVDSTCVGYIGHSEGGLIAILNAEKGARFIVTLAAPAVKGKDLLLRQNEKVAMAVGDQLTEDKKETLEAVFAAVDTEDNVTELARKLKLLLAEMPMNVRNAQIEAFTTPWYRYFVRLDPTDALKSIGKNKRVAMLALNGDMDMQVDADQNLSAIKACVPQAKVVRYPSLNHMMQPCDSVDKSLDYVGNPHEVAPQVIAEIVNFVKEVRS